MVNMERADNKLLADPAHTAVHLIDNIAVYVLNKLAKDQSPTTF